MIKTNNPKHNVQTLSYADKIRKYLFFKLYNSTVT